MRQGKVLVDDIVGGKTGACVTFADEGVSVEPFLLKDFASFDAVANVGEVADAVDVGGVATEDADVVKQCSLSDKVYIDVERAVLGTSKCFLHHAFTVNP